MRVNELEYNTTEKNQNNQNSNHLDSNIMKNDRIYASITNQLGNEIHSMDNSVKMNVQLLSQRNMLLVKNYIRELSGQLEALLEEHRFNVEEQDMHSLVSNNLYDVLKEENERLFHLEFNMIHETNDILKDQLHTTLLENDYQNCLIELNDLMDKFQNGVLSISHIIMLQDQMEQLTYYLSRDYKLHSDIKLYMEVKKMVELYKEHFHQMFSDSLVQLQYDNVKNAIQLKDNIIVRLQQQKYQEYNDIEEDKSRSV